MMMKIVPRSRRSLVTAVSTTLRSPLNLRTPPQMTATDSSIRCLSSNSKKVAPSDSSTSSFWASLRWNAARVLTESLSEPEKAKLLGKHPEESPSLMTTPETKSEPIENKNEEEIQKTIAEAIAQAKMEEAQRQDQKWEKQKESILQEAERAALERVSAQWKMEKFRQWQNDVESAKSTTTVEATAAPTTKDEAGQEHPVLGTAYADLGYKRVHLVSAKNLTDIPVWKKQRIYRHARVKTMAQDKMKTLPLGMPGVISLYEDKKGNLSIIDGQHRVGMMAVLQEKGVDGLDLDKILVEVYRELPEYGDDHAKDLFLEVNKAEPIKLVDMPGIAKLTDRATITEGAQLLYERFPDMFSASQRCRTPNVNIDNLRDAIFASDVIKRHSLKTPKALEQWLLEQNDQMAQKYQAEAARASVPAAAMMKADKHQFYLGLDATWYYN